MYAIVTKTLCWTPLKLVHSLLKSICHREWIRKLANSLNPCEHTIVELPHHCYELGRTAKFCHNYQSLTTDSVKCFSKVDKGHVEVHILFLAFLFKLSCGEYHVNCFCPSWIHNGFLVETLTVQGVLSNGSVDSIGSVELLQGSSQQLTIKRCPDNWHRLEDSLSVWKDG